jgi:AbrB family looped-hinge helix DNA binding protein
LKGRISGDISGFSPGGRNDKSIELLPLGAMNKVKHKYDPIPHVGSKSEFMPLTKVDDKGRVVLPRELRSKLDISPGDEFIVDELGPDSLVLKKVDLRAMIEDIIEKAKNVDLDQLEAEIEEEANKLARQKYKVLD